MTHLGHFNRQKTSDSWQGNCIKPDMIHLGHLQIKVPEPWVSKLLEKTVVIVFNVPSHIFTIFQKSQKSVEPRYWQVTTQFIKFEPVPIYLELSFVLFA